MGCSDPYATFRAASKAVRRSSVDSRVEPCWLLRVFSPHPARNARARRRVWRPCPPPGKRRRRLNAPYAGSPSPLQRFVECAYRRRVHLRLRCPSLRRFPANRRFGSSAVTEAPVHHDPTQLNRRVSARGLAGPLPAPGDSSQRSCSDVREKKGNRRHTTLSLLNADAKALCLRPDPELVKVFGIPQRNRSVESCPSARPKDAPVA